MPAPTQTDFDHEQMDEHHATDIQELVAAPKGRRFWVLAVVIGVVLGIAALTVSYIVSGGNLQGTSDAYVEGRVIRVSPKISGQVIALHVDDNSPVKVGDVLLEIDRADYQAKVDQASASLAAARSGIEQAEAAVLSADAAVGEAQAAQRSAKTEATRRRSDCRRYAAMGTDGISEQQLESSKAAADAADDQSDAAAKKLIAAQAQLNASKTNVATAESQASAAEAQLQFAELQLQYTKLLAPESGRITNKNVEVGAFVSTGQPLLAVVPQEVWVIANFKEVQLDRMRVGQPAQVRVDAFPDLLLRGRLQSLQAGTGSRFQLLPPENATGNWVKIVQRLPVKIVLDPGQPGLQRLAQGLSVEVTIDTAARTETSGDQ